MSYSNRYNRGKTMLSLYYHEWARLKNMTEKKYLMVDDYVLNNVLDRVEKILGIEEFGNTKILFNTDDVLPDNITLKNAVVLLTSAIKDDGNFYPQLFLEEALYDE